MSSDLFSLANLMKLHHSKWIMGSCLMVFRCLYWLTSLMDVIDWRQSKWKMKSYFSFLLPRCRLQAPMSNLFAGYFQKLWEILWARTKKVIWRKLDISTYYLNLEGKRDVDTPCLHKSRLHIFIAGDQYNLITSKFWCPFYSGDHYNQETIIIRRPLYCSFKQILMTSMLLFAV